ncbi:cytochrome c peroxidase [Sphingomonas sp. 2R-10]|uniref:cytochrome c peroxidase n=1 Tax=Sphingomonas sp. 2R-10 TaxID=3045148 RepID=UPI0024B8F697|nr:cytochrome c peroxidase [Sphingomonas sp. 2R-10]MDJ0277669.1 cytochrome c peroxidase [Sphingomonas sp. 2R-10]
MIGRAALALSALILTAAVAAPWRWTLPAGVVAPVVPADNPMSAAKVALGRRLFYDADLSIDGTMSCASCHEQKHAFADGNTTRPGVHGDAGRRNVPGLANVAWLPVLTAADPRVTTLEAQAAIPIFGLTPVKMGMHGSDQEIPRRLSRDACYRRQFRAAFPDRRGRIDMSSVTLALASFERSMVSFDTPADRGNLSREASAGKAIFGRICASCHSGPNFTDGRFHAVLPVNKTDRGLAETTGQAEDDGRFRTSSLRNVAVTGPWFHDGSARTLGEAIARHPIRLNAADMDGLLAYLEALTDRGFIENPAFAYPDDPCGSK